MFMKTMIIYASTYGYTKDCVEKLKEHLSGEVTIVNVMTDTIPTIEEFDNIVIGGSIYMGQIQKKLKLYCTQNLNLLMNKHIGLFLSCGLPEKFEEALKNAFPEELLENAIAIECFGGELRTSKMNILHKMITGIMEKAAAKEGKSEIMQRPENIIKLAESINKYKS